MNSVTSRSRLLLRKELRCWRSSGGGGGSVGAVGVGGGGGGRFKSTFIKFNDYLLRRRQEAEKTVLIQLPSSEVAQEVKSYLQKSFGSLNTLYHYTIPKKGAKLKGGGQYQSHSYSGGGGDSHWLLAEFSSLESVHKCLQDCRHAEGTMPFNSAMCWYQPEENHKSNGGAMKGGRGNKQQKEEGVDDGSSSLPKIVSERLETQGGSTLPTFKRGSTINQQLKLLEDSTKLSELGIRVRFFVAGQLEKSFGNMFPRGCVLPFGSTVSGIGRQTGDLDLVLVPDSQEVFPELREKEKGKGKLYAQSKLLTAVNTSNARFQSQRVMETIADIIQLFVPGCSHVQRILQARVPILRFSADFTDLQCDLSMTNSSGVHMSELIYIMCQIEPRFPTLLFAIRAWAAARKITNPVPGRQPTNFMFVLLLMYFLQKRQLLPTLDILFNNAGVEDQRLTADGIDCSFLRDTNHILKRFTPSSAEDSLAELLYDFFEFYSDFDFNSKGISLITGTSWGKPDAGPLYIQNPLERHLNVARNVSKEEVVRFKNECCSALWRLETSWHSLHRSKKGNHDGKTGSGGQGDEVTVKELLLTTLDNHNHSSPHEQARFQIKELFTK